MIREEITMLSPGAVFLILLVIGIAAGLLFDRFAGPGWFSRQIAGQNRLARRRVDPRRAVRPPLRYAVVELALLEHGVDQPDAGADQNSEEDQQRDIGDTAIAVALDVLVFALRRFGLVHRSPA
jgi:hypothetical protein